MILVLWEQSQEICAFLSCPGNSDACYNLGVSGLKVSFLTYRGEHSIVKLHVCS